MTIDKTKYIPLHCHTTYSILDSACQPIDYIDKCKEYNINAIAFTEHGNVYNWIVKKQYCDKHKIKYIHGVEAYVTETIDEKIRDNHHVVLLAKNFAGVKELNSAITNSFNLSNVYYQNRITADDIINMSSNIIVLGGCLGGIYSKSNNQKLIDRIDYVEIQPHIHPEQEELNKRALNSGKKIVATGDFHYTSQYKKDCTEILKASVSDSLLYETDWDLEFKSPKDFYTAFENLGYMSKEQIDLAFNSTIEIANMVEDFELDISFKYPELYDDSISLLHTRVWDSFKIKSALLNEVELQKRKDRIAMELDTMDRMGVHSFMLFMGELITWCKENDIGVGPARGSAGASYVGYLLGITDVEPVKYDLEFSRFMNADRISLMD